MAYTDPILAWLFRATVSMVLAAVVVGIFILVMRSNSPRMQRFAWFVVLLQGLAIWRLPLDIPWMAAELPAIASPTPQSVEASPRNTVTPEAGNATHSASSIAAHSLTLIRTLRTCKSVNDDTAPGQITHEWWTGRSTTPRHGMRPSRNVSLRFCASTENGTFHRSPRSDGAKKSP